jgi:hypothetical protein
MKISKHQKKWVALFNINSEGSGLQLIIFLHKLKVLNRSEFIKAKDLIIDNVSVWRELEYRRKCRHNDRQEERTYNSRPIRAIKPTKSRS